MERRGNLVVKRQKGIFERESWKVNGRMERTQPKEGKSKRHDDDCAGELGHGVS